MILRVKIADTPHAQAEGLMFKKHLPEDEGMVFIFKRAGNLNFWGRNTFIPLDIAFCDENKKIIKISSIEPHDLSPVTSVSPAIFAIETNKGYFKANNIKVGDSFESVDIREAGMPRDYNSQYIEFKKEKGDKYTNLKESQLAETNDPNAVTPDRVEKKNEQKTGTPVMENIDPETQLPVIAPGDLGKYLEDDKEEPPVEETPEQVDQPPVEEPVNPAEPENPTEPQNTTKYPTFSNVFQATEWAIANNEALRISYITKSGKNISRDIDPHGTFHSNSTKKEILVTFDETVKDIRAFVLQNIYQWAFLKKKFTKKFIVR